jgi:hypothetical protein
MPSTYYVAWWNVENLFDEENAENLFNPDNSPRRTDKVARAIRTFATRETDLTEWYFVANVIASQVLGVTETGAGRRFFDGWRWWSIEELKAFDGILAPKRFPQLLPPILRGDLPVEPIEIGE